MDYWTECVSEAFEDAGISATEEQIDTVASWVEGAHENYSMAHGHDCIPHPLEAEVRKRDERIREAEHRADRIEDDFKKNVAMRHRCCPSQVALEGDGHATVLRR